FEYLVEQSDKPAYETSWLLLSNIPDRYNKMLETFHHRHSKLPRPAKLFLDTKAVRVQPVDVLAPAPLLPQLMCHLDSYTLPMQTTTRSGHLSHPIDCDKITESITK
ncbi:uncharacterized protein EI90DRAFT_2920919, partial [Cantharellus anzutake]|uniref:uncharacterized protein n=1 Tax=Cantharellus anzutake TaxID=1750568 RepID=UPI001907CADD